jgi:hypothetical protein
LHRLDEFNEPTKEEPLSFVLFESPFSSVSTVSRGHPSLVSQRITFKLVRELGMLENFLMSSAEETGAHKIYH